MDQKSLLALGLVGLSIAEGVVLLSLKDNPDNAGHSHHHTHDRLPQPDTGRVYIIIDGNHRRAAFDLARRLADTY